MARTYSLKAEATLTLTSSAGNTINTITDDYTFATLTADEVSLVLFLLLVVLLNK